MKSISLVATGFVFVFLLAGETLADPKLPIIQSQGPDPIGGIGYMQTHITISRNGDGTGALIAGTHTWSAKEFEGFHGSVAVVALDQNQRLLWVSATQTYGVDGKCCHSDRTDSWSETIPAQVLNQTAYIAIKQRYTPKGINLDNIGSFLRGLENDLSGELGGLVHHVETTSIAPTSGVVAASPPPPNQKPFDLVWDMGAASESSGIFSGVDANGLPVNPLWYCQKDPQCPKETPSGLPNFKKKCAPNGKLNYSTLPADCTSQQPTTDFPGGGLSAAYCPLSSNEVMPGHLNWGLATYVGTLDWEEYESVDGDVNFKLLTPNNAALTDLNISNNYGLHLEFNKFETISNFRAPFWTTLFSNMGCTVGLDCTPNNAALASVSAKLTVVTGLIGVDGVHGGYTESHPVFSLAIRTQEQDLAGAVVDSWAFFLRNSGGEGDCSSHMHYWDSNNGGNWYFIQLPAPQGATEVNVVPSGTGVWTNQPGITGPVITNDSKWTYIGFQLPNPESGPELDGQISLQYTLPSAAPPPPPPPITARTSARLVKANPIDVDGDGWEELRKRITNPADAKAFEDTLRAQQAAMVKPRPHTIQLHVAATIAPHHPLALTTVGHKGILTRARAVQDPALASARNALDKKMLTVIPKAALPLNAQPSLVRPR